VCVGLGLSCARFGYENVGSDASGGIGGSFVPTASDTLDGGTAGAGNVGGAMGTAGAASHAGATGSAGAGTSGASGNGGATAAPGDAGDGGPGAGGTPVEAGVANCSDGTRNGDELGVDCGGSSCTPCTCSVGVPVLLGNPNFSGNDLWSPRLSSDGLSLYFGVVIGSQREQIGVATRPDRSSEFGLGQIMSSPVNQAGEGTPYVTPDGLALYFYSERSGGAGARDLYVATRANHNVAFGGVTPLTNLNTAQLDYHPWLSEDGLTIYFVSGGAGNGDLFRATRANPGAAFASPQPLTELNSPSDEGGITLSADGLEVIFTSNRPGGAGARDLYRAVRASTSLVFGTPQPITELDTTDNELDPGLSPDGTELYFSSNRGGGDNSIYRSARSCTR
jgi:hypothetical protein